MTEIKNAKIVDTFLGMEHGKIFTFHLTFDYGGGNSQTTGGYVLGNARETHSKGIDLIEKILEIARADSWEGLNGKPVKVNASHERIYGIGSYLGDNWLDFEKFLKNE